MKMFSLAFFAASPLSLAFIQVVLLFLVPLAIIGIVKFIYNLIGKKNQNGMYYHKK